MVVALLLRETCEVAQDRQPVMTSDATKVAFKPSNLRGKTFESSPNLHEVTVWGRHQMIAERCKH